MFADTKDRIIKAAAKLFCEHGYEKTTLRMIAEQVGVSHVSILGHFDNKIEIAARICMDFMLGLRRECLKIQKSLPDELAEDDRTAEILWWALHFWLLSENPAFCELFISFNQLGPITTTQAVHQVSIKDPDGIGAPPLFFPNRDDFVSHSLLAVVDAHLLRLIQMDIIGYAKATKLFIEQGELMGIIPKYQVSEAEIEELAETYIIGLDLDILRDLLLDQ